MFPSPAPECMVDKKQNTDTKSKEMRNRLSLWKLKLGAKGYTAHIVDLHARKLKLNNLLKFMFKWRRLLNSLASKWNSFPVFGVTSVFHKTSVCVNVGLDTLSLLNYAHRLIAVGLRNLPSQFTGSCGFAEWFCILSLHFVKYLSKVKRTYVCI